MKWICNVSFIVLLQGGLRDHWFLHQCITIFIKFVSFEWFKETVFIYPPSNGFGICVYYIIKQTVFCECYVDD